MKQLDDQARIQLSVQVQRADPAGQLNYRRPVPGEHRRGELAERRRDAIGYS